MNELKIAANTPRERFRKRIRIEEFLRGAMVFPRLDIQRVSILSDAMYFSDRIASGLPAIGLPTYNEAKESRWYQDVMKTGRPLIVLPDNNSRYFSITNVIRDLMDNNIILGVVKVDADYTTIRNLCESAYMGSSGGVIILTSQDQVVYSSFDPEQSGTIMTEIRNIAANKEMSDKASFTRTYLYNTVTLKRFNWQMITVDSLDSIRDSYSYSRKITVIAIIIGIVISSILMYLLMQYLLSPLFSIIKLMKTIERGNLLIRYQGKTDDEIGSLGGAMNIMLDRIDEMYKKNVDLNKKNYQARLFQKETQIQLLYSQIRPHFIYNALNMISTLIQRDRGEQAVDYINKLSLILHGIAYINKEIPIKMEINLVESYLIIQQSRYNDRLTYSLDIDQKYHSFILPALVLQPIVENAVIHNSEETQKPTHISIYSEENDDAFFICIADNGIGMSLEKLEDLKRQIQINPHQDTLMVQELPSARGLGLVNVNTRIQMRFGKQYGIIVNSKADMGTTIKVMLPLKWKEAESIDTDTDS